MFTNRWARRLGHSAATLAALIPAAGGAQAVWISHPEIARPDRQNEATSLQFRRSVDLKAVPAKLEIDVSADNRFVLFVNGNQVASGPARGDLAHWRFRRLDIAPYLKVGSNVIAAQVWNDGKAAGVAQISARTGFWLKQSLNQEPGLAPNLESGPGWLVRVDGSRRVTPAQPALAAKVGWDKYYASPPPEIIDASKFASGWNAQTGGRQADWTTAVPALAPSEAAPWHLVEDKLPAMRTFPMDGGKVIKAWGVRPGRFPSSAITIAANSEATLRLDMGALRAAYPHLITSGGAGARIDLVYAEAPYDDKLSYLPNRSDGQHGWILGVADTFLPDGSRNATFSPFWWRAWRYAEIKVKTGAEPLRLESFSRTGTGYPFDTRAHFLSDDPDLNRIWQIGWDTVKIDSYETYMDTAYWEQLQYVGDTRIQALVSYAVSGDPRLATQAIEAFAASRDKEGLIQSRWPANLYQSIPPFALLWVGMLHDYWMQQPDATAIRQVLPEMRSSLDWYARYVKPDGLVGTTSGWEFIDWRDGINNFPETKDPKDTERCIISLMYLGALKQAGDLEAALGDSNRASNNRQQAEHVGEAVRSLCWSQEQAMFADQPAKTSFSQHANILAVLYDVAPAENRQQLLERILKPGSWPDAPQGVTPSTFYFNFYLARALDHAGLGDRYLEMLAPWRAMLRQGFTTWPENPDPTRSDSHAWSAHPTYDLLAIVAGIQPAAAGYSKVRIAPHLGTLKRLDARFEHPQGPIRVEYRRNGSNRLVAKVILPTGLSGEFVWKDARRTLVSGTNRLVLD